MKWLFRQVSMVEAGLPSAPMDLLVQDGLIRRIAPQIIEQDAQVFSRDDFHVSPGWVDIGASHGDPGAEHREDLDSLRAVGAAGGFTALAPWPQTQPPVDHKAAIHYLLKESFPSPVEMLPLATVSEKGEGRELAELLDLHQAGAIAFSDGLHPLHDTGLLLRAFRYLKAVSGLLITFPMDLRLSTEGQMHEGTTSTLLGLPGIPSIAETLMVQRDLAMQQYTNGRLLLWGISAGESVALLEKSPALHQSVFAAVPLFNLAFSEEDLSGFNTDFKAMPPLRTIEDRDALRKGLKVGTLHLVSSNHTPWESDRKKVEFPYASSGAVSLQHVFPLLRTCMPDLPLPRLIELLAYSPRKILELPVPEIREGKPANLTFFSPSLPTLADKRQNVSRSEHSPLWGRTLIGKVFGVCHRGNLWMEGM